MSVAIVAYWLNTADLGYALHRHKLLLMSCIQSSAGEMSEFSVTMDVDAIFLVTSRCRCDRCSLRPISHLQFYRTILSHNFIVRQSCSMQLCMSLTATFSHKQELTNQRSLHSLDNVAQNIALLYSEKKLHDCSRVVRHVMSHLQYCHAVKLRNKVARQNCRCDISLILHQPHWRRWGDQTKYSTDCWWNKLIHTTVISPIVILREFVSTVVTTTELSPPPRWLATTEPTLPSWCFTVFLAVFLGAVSSLPLLRAAIVI